MRVIDSSGIEGCVNSLYSGGCAVVPPKYIALVKSFTNFIILNATSVCCLYGACKTSLNYYHQLASLRNNLTYLLFSANTFDL